MKSASSLVRGNEMEQRRDASSFLSEMDGYYNVEPLGLNVSGIELHAAALSKGPLFSSNSSSRKIYLLEMIEKREKFEEKNSISIILKYLEVTKRSRH